MPIATTRWLPLPLLVFGAILCVLSALDRFTEHDVPAALDLGPSQARRTAVVALADGDFAAALTNARTVVSRDPMGRASASLLGSALLGSGRPVEARQAFTVAAQLGWRDRAAQTYWLMTAIAIGDEQIAAERLDALLRTGTPDPTTLQALATLEATPTGRAALAARLAANPGWGLWYLSSAAKLSGEVQARRDAVLVAASHQGFAPLAEGVSTAVFTLLGKGDFEPASTLYHAFGGAGPAGKAVANPGFEEPLERFSSAPFTWQLFESGDVDVRRQAAPAGDGHALYISSTGSVTENVAQQTLLLSPGQYRLSWQAVDDRGQSTDDVSIRLSCMPSGTALFSPEQVASDRHGQHRAAFTIPGSACIGQSLLVVAEPQDPSSQTADWLDNVELRRVTG